MVPIHRAFVEAGLVVGDLSADPGALCNPISIALQAVTRAVSKTTVLYSFSVRCRSDEVSSLRWPKSEPGQLVVIEGDRAGVEDQE
ncbi:MAG: hypothetical protein BMS9Abin12_1636 [Acidimicrobiia bacterium]|nr:MAG: hypothetical protein BMS9Abin12_1636 [Acidimicrobiia bacterium]